MTMQYWRARMGLTCPSDEILATYVEMTNKDVPNSSPIYNDFERLRIGEHLNYCPRCYALVSEVRAVVQRDKQIAQDEVREEYRESYRQIADRTHDD